ncbi:hypothetical protein [Massilia suwonensis]|uniref:Uncharacterized protein n=1 Tax=Massilia suwonensis TaxID=648895 RepID=A0ABW0MRU3_9BURK
MKARSNSTSEIRQASIARACTRLLALSIAFLHSVLRTDWLRLVCSPSIAAGFLFVIPATWLAVREHCFGMRMFGTERRRRVRLHPNAA